MEYRNHTFSYYPKEMLLHFGRFSFEECFDCGIKFLRLTNEEQTFVEDYREQSILDKMLDFYGCLDSHVLDFRKIQ